MRLLLVIVSPCSSFTKEEVAVTVRGALPWGLGFRQSHSVSSRINWKSTAGQGEKIHVGVLSTPTFLSIVSGHLMAL